MHMITISSYFKKLDPLVTKLYPLACLLNTRINTFRYYYATVFCRKHKVVHKIRYVM